MKLQLPQLTREPGPFRPYLVAHAVSLVGDQVSFVAVPLVAVLALDAGPGAMGVLTALAWLPNLLFGLHAGAWLDRHGRRRRTMIAMDIGRAALLLSVPLAFAADLLTLTQLFVVVFALGALSVVFNVADTALFVAVVPERRFVEANQLLHGSRAFSFVAGPSLGGIAVQVLSAPVAIVADALSFLASAFALTRIRPQEPPVETVTEGMLSSGARWILASPIVRPALFATATINLFNFAFAALLLLYATETLGVSPGTIGLVLGAGAVGGVVGSVLVRRIVERVGVGPAFVVGCVLFPAPLILVPLAHGHGALALALLFAAEFGAGFGVMVLDISIGSIFAAAIPHRLRSRVSGAYGVVNNGVRPIGALLGGALGTWIGIRETLWIVTIASLAGVLFVLRSPVVALRDLPEASE